MGQYDILWKGMIESIFDDLMRFVFPYVDTEIDLDRGVEFLDKELEALYPNSMETQTRVMDKLAKVHVCGEDEQCVLIRLEIQGWDDPNFAKRMFQYYYRAYDRHNQPLTSVVIFTDRMASGGPDRYSECFLESGVDYHYKTLYFDDYSEQELMQNDNSFAIVLLIAKMASLKKIGNDDEFDAALLEQKTKIAEILHKRRKFSKEKVDAIMLFLNQYVKFRGTEKKHIFDGIIDRLTNKKNSMGIIEQFYEIKKQEGLELGKEMGLEIGKEMGRVAERESFVTNLLNFTELSADKIASLANTTVDFVNQKKAVMGMK